MENKLLISEEIHNDQLVLNVCGRLDANNAGYLDDKLSELIQKGKYTVGLNLQDISFLSSAGIRILVKQNKAFRIFSGELTITAFSENVRSVLDMVGMTGLFQSKISDKKVAPEPKAEKMLERSGFSFQRSVRENKTLPKLEFRGSPEKIESCAFGPEDMQTLQLKKPWFGLGLGAFGQDFDDCQSRFGEFVALGDSMITLPSDQTVTPDYMLRSGDFIPEIQCLFSIGFSGTFQQEIYFSPDTESSISLTSLVETIVEMDNHRNFALLFIAESNGLVGASIKSPPTSGKRPFAFPEVRDSVKFTTEPSYIKEMTVAIGIFSKEPGERLTTFLRPIGEKGNLFGHVHAVVFTYLPLRKENPDYPEAIGALLENAAILDVLHLLNDNREINGIGESSFKAGVCWSTELDPDSII